jgi:ankyrin repeat protein
MKKAILLVIGIILTMQFNVFAGKDPEIIKYSKKGDLAKVQQLIASGAEINAKDKDNNTALMWAIEKGHLDIARFLIDKGADLNVQGTSTALINAAGSGYTELVTLLLEKGANINSLNSAHCSALMIAAFMGEPETAKILIDKGAKLDITNAAGVTALMMARQKGVYKPDKRKEVANLLVAAGAK